MRPWNRIGAGRIIDDVEQERAVDAKHLRLPAAHLCRP